MKRTLMLAAILMTVCMLFSINITPDSPDYDAYKMSLVNQLQTSSSSVQASSGNTVVASDAKDVPALLIPLDASFTQAMLPNDDGSSAQINLGFNFSLYGINYTACYINNNGNITFEAPEGSFTSWPFPILGYPMLAAFFADVDTRGTGNVYYRIEANRMVVIWDQVGYYNSNIDKVNTFEIIMTDGTDPLIGLGNNVCFSYADMQWTTGSASGGTAGFGGSPATVGINKGDGVISIQSGRFDQAGIAYDGGDGLNDGVDWLDDQDLYMQVGGANTLVVTPSDPATVTDGIGMPGGLILTDPTVSAYYATYDAAGFLTVSIPVGPGLWYGYIYYTGAWHQADVFPVTGPGTVVFSNVPFTGGKESLPIILDYDIDPTLPVELSSFLATVTSQNNVKLTWTSESEIGMLGYRVYRNDSNNQATAMMITPTMIGATNTSTTQYYSYSDNEVSVGNSYWYWLESVDYNSSQFHGPVIVNVEGDVPPVLPTQTSMRSAYPNPFQVGSSTSIVVNVKEADAGTVTIYNILGQTVASYPVTAGINNLSWKGLDSRGNLCGSGIYFYKLSTNTINQTMKMVIVK